MTPREKILRDGIDKVKKILFTCSPTQAVEAILEMDKILTASIKQADAVKDGPSEEDREWILHLETTFKSDKNTEITQPGYPRFTMEKLIQKLKEYMGIK